MAKTISVLSKVPNLVSELKLLIPAVSANFHECLDVQDSILKSSEIIISDPDLLLPIINKLPETKWIQSTWAGVDVFINELDCGKSLPIITRYSGEHFGRIMAEYVIAAIYNNERDNDTILENQRKNVWSREGKISQYRIISDLNIGIMGVGNIGKYIGNILKNLGGNIYGYGRRDTLDLTNNKYLSNYYSKSNLDKFLSNCDYIVNLMPSTDDTRGLLNGDTLRVCKDRGSVFINIGRGTIISEEDLINAIQSKWISAAILDVFNKEPLPKSSPLWNNPQVKITPHVAGLSRAKDIAEQFKENYSLYLENQPIPTIINLSTGY